MADNRPGKLYEEIAARMMEQIRSGVLRPGDRLPPERALAEEAHKETQRLQNEVEKQREALAAQRDEIIKKAREEARRTLIKAQRESEELIATLKKARAKDSAPLKEHELSALKRQMQSSIDGLSGALRSEVLSATEPPKDLKPGETVELTMLDTQGTVLAPPDEKGEVMVQAGVMKMKVHISQMRRVKAGSPAPQKRKPGAPKSGSSASSLPAAGPASMECDVRGMTLEEAIGAVDLFLDNCAMQHLKQVQIIHGKGTGVLRAGIQQHLKNHRNVAEFRLGRYGEGEDGVTVVTLK